MLCGALISWMLCGALISWMLCSVLIRWMLCVVLNSWMLCGAFISLMLCRVLISWMRAEAASAYQTKSTCVWIGARDRLATIYCLPVVCEVCIYDLNCASVLFSIVQYCRSPSLTFHPMHFFTSTLYPCHLHPHTHPSATSRSAFLLFSHS